MSIGRIALIFDNEVRPETTGGYCLRALRELARVEHFLPSQMATAPKNGFDLYLNIDDGLRYHWPADLRPAAFWAIDTHMDFPWCLEKAHGFDCVFAAQRDGAANLVDEGITTTWLPLACDPDMHRPYVQEKTLDVCFVGHVFPGPRAELLELLQRHFPKSFVGQRFFADMARTYSAACTVFNRSIRNDINMRVFEALACGSLLVTNALDDNGQAELFQNEQHLVTYHDAEELLDKLRFYVPRPELRTRIERAGLAEVTAKHTYHHRMEQLLAQVEHDLASTQVAVLSPLAKRPLAPVQHARAAEPNAEQCDLSYFGLARPELLDRIPLEARRVLDIGCAAGCLGEALQRRQQASVVGIELNPAAAAAARQRLSDVFQGDVETLDLPFAAGSFDVVVCGDVLEHLERPEELLRRVRDWLAPGGQVIASVPNVRHWTVVTGLLDGNWTYEPAGLLDDTHLRFFTRADMVDLFHEAGFDLEQIDVVPGPGYAEWDAHGRPGTVDVGDLHLEGLSSAEAEEFFAYQYLVVATPRPVTAPVPAFEPSTILVSAKGSSDRPKKTLRILHLGDFASAWRHETLTANALEALGHFVRRLHEYAQRSPEAVLAELDSGRYDCLLFYKGRIGARTPEEIFDPTGAAIVEVLRQTNVPCYTWYVDRAYQYDFQPSRELWMRQVAPLCRVALVAETALTQTPWARWHLLREPCDAQAVRPVSVPEADKRDVAFLGQIYGARAEELAPVRAAFPVEVIEGVYGSDLSAVLGRFRIVLGPRFPCVSGYWGNRVYVVLGHGGFFLAPEVPGMREEGLVAGEHFAALGSDPVASLRYWLARPAERQRIAQAGKALVLRRFTYAQAAAELCRVIAATLD